MKIIETHCHLDYLKNEPLDEILKKSAEAGIERIITISVQPSNFDDAFNIANDNEMVYFTQGIHPHEAKLSTDEHISTIKERCSHPKMVAVGEIGLDYHYTHSPRETQIKVFEKQLQIAIDYKKPVVIHSREADDDMIAVLKNFAPLMSKKGVIHSFTSEKKLAECALDEGFYIGFNGIITFKNAQAVRDITAYCPMERLLLETDAPFLTPVPHRGKENAPYYLPHIVEKIAEIKNVPVQKVLDMAYQNSIDLFFT